GLPAGARPDRRRPDVHRHRGRPHVHQRAGQRGLPDPRGRLHPLRGDPAARRGREGPPPRPARHRPDAGPAGGIRDRRDRDRRRRLTPRRPLGSWRASGNRSSRCGHGNQGRNGEGGPGGRPRRHRRRRSVHFGHAVPALLGKQAVRRRRGHAAGRVRAARPERAGGPLAARRPAAVGAAPRRAEPGWHYSSPAFLLAGLIVERASGQPYPEFVTERILSPLKLTRTTMGPAPDGAARGYEDGEPVPSWDLTAMPGTGDLWSTTGDLTRFVTELLTASSLRAMVTAHAALNDDDAGEPKMTTTGYGYGTYTGTFAGHPARYHTGDNPGYLSFACWIPDLEASVVVLLNDSSTGVTSLVRQLLPAVLEA